MNLEFDMNIIHLKDVNSTNEFAINILMKNSNQESFVITDFQTIWKGSS